MVLSVSSFDEAQDLRDALRCSGPGTFYTEWTGEVNIGDLAGGIVVSNGSSLNVTGIGTAVVNGDNRVRIFTLTDGSQLHLNNISLENGQSLDDNGGAVLAKDSSYFSAMDCSFLNNSVGLDVGSYSGKGGEVSKKRKGLWKYIILFSFL